MSSSSESNWYQKEVTHRTVALLGQVGTEGRFEERKRLTDEAAYNAIQGFEYLHEYELLRRGKYVPRPEDALLYASAEVIGDSPLEVCELGSTFGAFIYKLAHLKERLGSGLSIGDFRYIGVEYSDYFRNVTNLLHNHSEFELDQYKEFSDVPTPTHPRILYSHYVGGYAFTNTEDLVDWVKTSTVAVIQERFSHDDTDTEIGSIGKRLTLFDFSKVVRHLTAHGYQFHFLHLMNGVYFGAPLVSTSMVIEKLGPEKQSFFLQRAQAIMEQLGIKSQLVTPSSMDDILSAFSAVRTKPAEDISI